jgi:hypothetical protein
LEKPEFTLVFRYQDYRNVSPAGGSTNSFYGAQDLNALSHGIDFASFTFPFRIGKVKIVPQVSYQRAISFDLETTSNDVYFRDRGYNPDLGQYVTFQGTLNQIQDFNGGFDTLSISLGTQIFKRINIGVSGNFWMKGYTGILNQNYSGEVWGENSNNSVDIAFSTSEILTMELNGFNFNVGILVDILENLKIGVVYKSSFNADVEHSLTVFEGNFYDDENEDEPVIDRSDVSTLEWPETWGAGISFRPIDPLTISFDATFTKWSTSVIRNFRLPEREGSKPNIIDADVYFPSLVRVRAADEAGYFQYDSRQFRLGLEYVLFGSKTLIPLRLGAFTDSQYYPDSAGNRINFFGITGGIGVKWKGLTLDLAVIYEFGSYLAYNEDYSTTKFSELKPYLSASFSF